MIRKEIEQIKFVKMIQSDTEHLVDGNVEDIKYDVDNYKIIKNDEKSFILEAALKEFDAGFYNGSYDDYGKCYLVIRVELVKDSKDTFILHFLTTHDDKNDLFYSIEYIIENGDSIDSIKNEIKKDLLKYFNFNEKLNFKIDIDDNKLKESTQHFKKYI